MKTILSFLSVLILILALSACDEAATSPTELAAATDAPVSVQLPSLGTGGETPPPAEAAPSGDSVFLPSLGAGDDGLASGPGGGGAEAGGGIDPAQAESPAGAFIPNVGAGDTPAGSLPDAYVDLQASSLTVRVGETITFTATPVEIGLPFYYLVVRDEGVQDAPPIVQITYENVATPQPGASQVLAFVSAQAGMDQAVFVVRALAPGVTTVGVTATGEILSSAGASWSGAGSGELVIMVSP